MPTPTDSITPTTKKPPVKIALVCNECGKHWKVSEKNLDPQCPKCNGVDYEVL